jgi:hypothetical protein
MHMPNNDLITVSLDFAIIVSKWTSNVDYAQPIYHIESLLDIFYSFTHSISTGV